MFMLLVASLLICSNLHSEVTVNGRPLTNYRGQIAAGELFGDAAITSYAFREGYEKLGVSIEIENDTITIQTLAKALYGEHTELLKKLKGYCEREWYKLSYAFPLTFEKSHLVMNSCFVECPAALFQGKRMDIANTFLKDTDVVAFRLESSPFWTLPSQLEMIVFRLTPGEYHSMNVFAGNPFVNKAVFSITGVKEVTFIFSDKPFS